MRNLFLFLCLIYFGALNAQGNLQFNQVITYNIGGIANQYDNVNFTVPVGKVTSIFLTRGGLSDRYMFEP